MQIVLFLVTIVTVISYTFIPERIFDSDTLWHIKAGEWILSNHTIPVADTFSWSAQGVPWVAHEWLFETFLASLVRIHPLGIAIFSMILILAGLFVYWKLFKSATDSETTAAVFYIFALVLFNPGWSARPQLVGYTFFTATLYLLYKAQKQPQKLWLLPLLFIIWSNCHASVIVGLGLIGIKTFLSFFPEFETNNLKHTPGNKKTLICVFASCALASIVNPLGLKLWFYALKVSTDPAYKAIQEWQPPSNLHLIALIFFILAMAMILMIIRKCKVELLIFILALLTMFGTMTSIRHFIYFIIVWMVILAQLAGKLEFSKTIMSFTVTLLCILFSINLYRYGWMGNDMRELAEKADYPVTAVDWLVNNHAVRIFNHYNWGGYMISRGIPVFIDGRADMYHLSGFENDPYIDYLNFKNFKQAPEEILEKYGVNYVLFPNDSGQVLYLKKCGWKEVFSDNRAVVLTKQILNQ